MTSLCDPRYKGVRKTTIFVFEGEGVNFGSNMCEITIKKTTVSFEEKKFISNIEKYQTQNILNATLHVLPKCDTDYIEGFYIKGSPIELVNDSRDKCVMVLRQRPLKAPPANPRT